jgi:hypothetical protein
MKSEFNSGSISSSAAEKESEDKIKINPNKTE